MAVARGRATRTYPNGSIYEGELLQTGERDGKGTMRWPSGDVYEGEWVAGNRTGRGTFRFANGNVFAGDFVEGELHGKGTLTYANGDIRQSEWSHGMSTGQGCHKYANGDVYEGDFAENEIHGRGTMKYADGSEYNGDWAHGKWEGRGVRRSAVGDVYEGDFVAGEMNGQGTYKVAGTADVHRGTWIRGKRTGVGSSTYADGSSYEGGLVDNEFQGNGTRRYADASVYAGEWKRGKRSGKGSYTFADGSIYRGDFADDEFHGRGTRTYVDESSYEGGWNRGQFSGQGTRQFADGTVYTGNFQENQCHGQGKCVYTDGSTYVGGWARGLFEGRGTHSSPDGAISYTGDFVKGKYHGSGAFAYSFVQGGFFFEGTFVKGKRSGVGTYRWGASGDTLTCRWLRDKPDPDNPVASFTSVSDASTTACPWRATSRGPIKHYPLLHGTGARVEYSREQRSSAKTPPKVSVCVVIYVNGALVSKVAAPSGSGSDSGAVIAAVPVKKTLKKTVPALQPVVATATATAPAGAAPTAQHSHKGAFADASRNAGEAQTTPAKEATQKRTAAVATAKATTEFALPPMCHFDKGLDDSKWVSHGVFEAYTLSATHKDFIFAKQLFESSCNGKFHVTKVKLIRNAALRKTFAFTCDALSRQPKQPAAWLAAEDADFRANLMNELSADCKKFSPQPAGANLLPAWFGTTDLRLAGEVCAGGFATTGRATTRLTTVGGGNSGSEHLAHTLQGATTSALFLCWVACGNAYPVTAADAGQRQLATELQKTHNSFIVPMAPRDLDGSELQYVPASAGGQPVAFRDVVLFTHSCALVHCLVSFAENPQQQTAHNPQPQPQPSTAPEVVGEEEEEEEEEEEDEEEVDVEEEKDNETVAALPNPTPLSPPPKPLAPPPKPVLVGGMLVQHQMPQQPQPQQSQLKKPVTTQAQPPPQQPRQRRASEGKVPLWHVMNTFFM
eukprot:TRINITY_DN1592_c0_g1_i1.p1 TRINITY_DN1592_c0_g1~~TRINITY_DN1592_c0_g1_i1.p1  ORF type:complete len:967 (-),score=199.00 TRINITY_DN1592_c0_g1_i1:43-2913(-)